MTARATCKECKFLGTWHFAGPLPRHGQGKPDVVDVAEAIKDRFGCQVCKNKKVAEQTGANPSEGDEYITDLETAWRVCNGTFFAKKTSIKERLSGLL